jgi:flagellar motility protein MotE (MotC chaperone)
MMKFLVRIRVLPIAMFAAALILTAKIGDIADLLSGKKPVLEIAQVQAQQQAQPKGVPTPLQAPAPAQPPAQAPVQEAPAAAAPQPAGPVPASTGAASDPANDPTLLSQSEIDILQQLAERRELLERQSQEMTQRQGLLAAAELRIDRKIQELKGLQAAIDTLVKKHNEQEELRIQSLVKLYENMKPKDASRIFEELDYETLLLVAERMKERKLAPIMSSMDPAKAKEVTVRLTTSKKLPQAGASVGG